MRSVLDRPRPRAPARGRSADCGHRRGPAPPQPDSSAPGLPRHYRRDHAPDRSRDYHRRHGRQGEVVGRRDVLGGPRRLDTAGMGLAAAGVAASDQAIATDDALRTTNPRIYAAGEGRGPRYARAVGRAGHGTRRGPQRADAAGTILPAAVRLAPDSPRRLQRSGDYPDWADAPRNRRCPQRVRHVSPGSGGRRAPGPTGAAASSWKW